MDKFSSSLLKLYNERNSLSIYDISIIFNTSDVDVVAGPIIELHSQGFLKVNMLDESKCEDGISLKAKLHITQAGKTKLYDLRQEAKNHKYKLLVDWLHIGLTVIAVVISIIALLKP